MVDAAACKAVGTLYNALMTALVLGLVTRRGEDTAREYVFRHFRRQHLEKFLPGLQKLGLADEHDAPACALYHYHSNALGGVKTGYLRESDSKAWVRYPPPRWIHLTQQGVNQNEDGTYSWKFDNYVRAWPPYDMSYGDIEHLWTQIDRFGGGDSGAAQTPNQRQDRSAAGRDGHEPAQRPAPSSGGA